MDTSSTHQEAKMDNATQKSMPSKLIGKEQKGPKKKTRKYKNLMKDILKSDYDEEAKKKRDKKVIEKQTGGGKFEKMPDRI